MLVRQLLLNSLSLYGDQQITYRGQLRHSYREFRQRVGRLASALAAQGVAHGTPRGFWVKHDTQPQSQHQNH